MRLLVLFCLCVTVCVPLGLVGPAAAAGVDLALAVTLLVTAAVAVYLKGRLDDLIAGVRRDNDAARTDREVLRRRLDVLEQGEDGLAGVRKAVTLLDGRVEGLRRRLEEVEELVRHADLKAAAAVATAEKAGLAADDHARSLAGRLEVRAGEVADLYERLRRAATILTTSTIPCNRPANNGAIYGDGKAVRDTGDAAATPRRP